MTTFPSANIKDLPTGVPPSPTPVFVRKVAEQWHRDYLASSEASRERAIPELPLRASAISKRCDRNLYYSLLDLPETNPSDAAGIFRMKMGSMVHDLVETALFNINDLADEGNEWRTEDDGDPRHEDLVERKATGWYMEVIIDLQPAGFPGSAHADAIYYRDGVPLVVVEVKSLGGYDFKVRTAAWGGGPKGPRWAHSMQAGMVALAIKSPKFLDAYFALEPFSVNEATKMKLDEYGRFTAEWVYNTEDWAQLITNEAARQRRVLSMAQPPPDPDGNAVPPILPEPAISDPEVPAGAVVINPRNGTWVTYDAATGDVMQTSTTWMCGYCEQKDRCLDAFAAEKEAAKQ